MLSRSRSGCSPSLRLPTLQRQAHDGLVDAPAERLIEAAADAHQDAAADQVEQAQRRIEAGRRGSAARPASARCGSAARGRRLRA